MKKVYANGLDEFLGDEIQELFYLMDIKYSDNTSNKWQRLLLCDKTGKIAGTAWSQNMDPRWSGYCGSVVEVTGKVEIYLNIYGLNIFNVRQAQPGEYDRLDFEVSIEEGERRVLIERFHGLEAMVSDVPLRSLLAQAYGKQERFQKLCDMPCDRGKHHAYRGGWLEYTVEVAEMALYLEQVCGRMRKRLFHETAAVDQSLLLAGALLHNIGKLSELKPGIETRTTRRGYLVGPVNDSVITVSVLNNSLPVEKRIQDTTNLVHVIASAGGEDTDIPPRLAEAVLLSEASRTVSRTNAFYSLFASYDFEHLDSKGREIVFSKYFDRMMMRGGVGHV